MTKILILAPHPDDEVLGCGGAIVKHKKRGDKVYLCIVTRAYLPDWSEEYINNRPKEIEKANRILGIKKTYFLDFPTAKLDTVPQKELNDSILKVINEVRPKIIYLPYARDISKDHRLVFESAMVAVRPNAGTCVKKILSYETSSESEGGKNVKVFVPNVYEDIGEELETKIEAMKAYKSEVKEYPHPRSLEMIKILAQKRGSEAGLRFAESFILIREIK